MVNKVIGVVFLLLYSFTSGIVMQDTIPDPPEPVASLNEVIVLDADIDVPAQLELNSYVQCDLIGITLTDTSKGKMILRVYPKDCVEIRDGISFINKTPYLVLHPEKVGTYNLIFIIHRVNMLVFVEKEFEVIGVE